MGKLPMCRVCLVENVRMYVVVNKSLQKLYEKLTDVPFVTKDNRPMLACFFCCTKLKQCWQFQRKCLEAEELFTQMLNEDNKLNTLRDRGQLQFYGGFVKTPTENVDFYDIERIIIKEEPVDCEILYIEPKEEHLSYDVKQENQDNSYLDVNDIPRQYSGSYSENDVPTEGHTEVKEEQDVTKKKRAIIGVPVGVAKKPKLEMPRVKIEETITKAQEKSGQSDSKDMRNIPKCTSEVIIEFNKPFTITNGNNSINNTDVDNNCLSNSNNDDITCEVSNDTCIDNNDVNERRKLCIQEKYFTCDVCQRRFTQKGGLTYHMRTHTGEKPYKCDICQRGFTQKSGLKNHIRTHTGEKPFTCNICQRSFSQKNALKSHIRLHNDEKPHKCKICGHSFSRKDSLTSHIHAHSVGEERYTCDICHLSYKTAHILNQHKRIHFNGEHKCDVCLRSFSMKHHLTAHMRIHTGEKPYKCEMCQRSFSRKGDLISHVRIHTGEKPYKCDICQRSFTQKSTLRSHIRTHTGEKPYTCNVCGLCFSFKCNLTQHIRQHSGEKPYSCDICHRSFFLKHTLAYHVTTHARV